MSEKISNYVSKPSTDKSEKHFSNIKKYQNHSMFDKDDNVVNVGNKEVSIITDRLNQKNLNEMNIFDSLKNSHNLNEIVNVALDTVLRDYLKRFNSPKGLSFSVGVMYDDLLHTLSLIDSRLSDDNIMKGNIQILIDNFFFPKDKGERYIKSFIDGILIDSDTDRFERSDLVMMNDLLKSGILTLIDLSKKIDGDKLKVYIQEFKNIPQLQDFINSFPDFEKMLDLITSLLKGLDKDKISINFDEFFLNNSENIMLILNKGEDASISQDAIMSVANGGWKILDSILTKENANICMDKLSGFDIIKSNPILSESFDILNNGKLSDDERFLIFKQLSGIIDVMTLPSSDPLIVNSKLDEFIMVLSRLSKDGKIDETKIVTLFKKILDNPNSTSNRGFFELLKNVKSFRELFSLLKDNWSLIKVGFFGSDLGEGGLDTVLRQAIRTGALEYNVRAAGGSLVGRLGKVFKVTTSDILLNARNTLTDNVNGHIGSITTHSSTLDSTKASHNISELIVNEFGKKGKEFLKSKLNSTNPTINKSDLIDFMFNSFRQIINTQQSRQLLLNNAKMLGFDIKSSEQFILEFTNYFTSSPKLKVILNNIADGLLARISGSGNTIIEINKIQSEFEALSHDFIKGYIAKGMNGVSDVWNDTRLIDPKTKSNIIDLSVDTVYDNIKNPKLIRTVLDSFPEVKSALPLNLTDKDILNFSILLSANIDKGILKDYISKKILSGNFDENTFKKTENIISLIIAFLDDPRCNKKGLINGIIASGIFKKVYDSPGNIDFKSIDDKVLLTSVDLIYSGLDKTDDYVKGELCIQLGLDRLFGKVFGVVLKNIPKDVLKSAISNNMLFIKDALNGSCDKYASLKFASDLYSKLPIDKRLGCIDGLVDTGILSKIGSSGEGTRFIIDEKNINYITDIIFDTISTNNMDKVNMIIKKINPGLHLAMTRINFGKSNIDNIGILLNSLGKENFKKLITDNLSTVNKILLNPSDFEFSHDNIVLINNMLILLDPSKIKNSYDGTIMGKNERFGLDLFESFQKTIKSNHNDALRTALSMQKLNNSFQKKEFTSLDLDEMQDLGEDLFDFMNSIITNEFIKIKSQNPFLTDIMIREKLAGSFDLPTGKGSGLSLIPFILNNKYFSMYWGVSYILNSHDYVVNNSILDYFQDKSNKKNMGNTFKSYIEGLKFN